MNITTQRDLIRAVADRWHSTYAPFDERFDHAFSFATGEQIPLRPKEELWDSLKNLDLGTVTAEEVNAIIGNSSWTRLTCDECGGEAEALITVGRDPNYRGCTASLCHTCIAKAYTLMTAAILRTDETPRSHA